MDLLWYAFENKYDPAEVAPVMEMTEEQVRSVFVNFESFNQKQFGIVILAILLIAW